MNALSAVAEVIQAEHRVRLWPATLSDQVWTMAPPKLRQDPLAGTRMEWAVLVQTLASARGISVQSAAQYLLAYAEQYHDLPRLTALLEDL